MPRLKSVLHDASKGRYGRDIAVEIREAVKVSIGSVMPAKSLELRHTIRLIRELDAQIDESEAEIQSIMNQLHSPITTIPGIGYRMGWIEIPTPLSACFRPHTDNSINFKVYGSGKTL